MSSKLDRIKDWLPLIRTARYRAENLPDLANSSARNLRRHFLERFGKPTQERLDELRAEEARDGIMDGESEKVLADRLGFKSSSHFSVFFKRRFKVSPRMFLSRAFRRDDEPPSQKVA